MISPAGSASETKGSIATRIAVDRVKPTGGHHNRVVVVVMVARVAMAAMVVEAMVVLQCL